MVMFLQAYVDEEIQQRAVEFLAITERPPTDASVCNVLAEMPKFPERTSALERSLAGLFTGNFHGYNGNLLYILEGGCYQSEPFRFRHWLVSRKMIGFLVG